MNVKQIDSLSIPQNNEYKTFMIVGTVSVVIKVSNAESNLNYICGFSSNRSVNTHIVGVMKTGLCYVGK